MNPAHSRQNSGRLTASQDVLVWMIASGMAYKEIAAHKGITVMALKQRMQKIFKRLGVRNKTAVVARWMESNKQ